MTAPPDISVIMTSFNRGEKVRRSVASVLDQTHGAVELVVVDSSDDDTLDVLGTIRDERLTVLSRPNLGMPVARNMGLDVVTGEWVGFLDDDDALHPEWAARLLAAVDDETQVVVAGHTRHTPDGRLLAAEPPGPLGVDARTFIAGTFIVRTALLRDLGGMLEGLPAAHHWELCVRLAASCGTSAPRVATVAAPVVGIEVRPVTSRDLAAPLQLYDGTRWILARHRAALAGRRDRRATFSANVAVPAARTGMWPIARRWMAAAVAAAPLDPHHWARLLLTCVPPLGRRVWGDAGAYTLANKPSRRGLRGVADLAADRGASPDLLMLPYGYTEGRADDAGEEPDGPESAARRLAEVTGRSRLRRLPSPSVGRLVDVVGEDLPDPTGDREDDLDVVCCPVVLSRVADPYALLRSIRARLSPQGEVVVTELDRDAIDGPDSLGPPAGTLARRRWTPEELALVIEGAGLRIVDQRPRVPRLPWSRRRDPVILIVASR